MKLHKAILIFLLSQLFNTCYNLPPKRILIAKKIYASILNKDLQEQALSLGIEPHPTEPPSPRKRGSKSKTQSKHALDQLSQENNLLRKKIKEYKECLETWNL